MSRFHYNYLWVCAALVLLTFVGGAERVPSRRTCKGITEKLECTGLYSLKIGSCKWIGHDNQCKFFAKDSKSMEEHNTEEGGAHVGDKTGDMYQGDLLITDDNRKVMLGTDTSTTSSGTTERRRSLVQGVKLFSDNTVTWYFDSGFSGEKDAARDAMDELNEDTGGCLKFKEVASDYSGPAVRIHDENSGSCHVDYLGSPDNRSSKRVNMNLGWCGKSAFIGSIQHEFIHALGFYHEQSRPDRDDYINVQWDNIADSWKSQWYKKTSTTTQDLEYDYTSIMHYGPNGSSGTQFITKDRRFQDLVGQRTHISDLDIRGLQLLYKCDVTVYSGYIRLGEKDNTKWCMYDLNDQGSVVLRECGKKIEGDGLNHGLNHHWTYNKITGQIRAMYGVSRSGVGKCLSAKDNSVELMGCDEARSEQQWVLGDGKLMLKGQSLCVTASKLESNAALALESCSQTSANKDFQMQEFTTFTDTSGFQPTLEPTSSGKYKVTDKGSNSCDTVGGDKVDTLDECKAASTDLGLDYKSSSSWSGYPGGCFKFGSSQSYFNTNGTGGSNSNAAKICSACKDCTPAPTQTPAPTTTPEPTSTPEPTAPQAQPTPAPTPQPGSYVLAGSGKNSCGNHSTLSESACKVAAKSLGYTFKSVFTSGSWPAGCFKYSTSSAYYNKHSTGKGNGSGNPICEKCENCTSTPTTTNAPISTAKPTSPQAQPTSAPTSPQAQPTSAPTSPQAQPTSAPTPKPGSYVLAGSGKNSCGNHSTLSESACKVAAKSLGYTFKSSFDSGSWPAGCFNYASSNAYYNKHSTGKGNGSANPICEKCENCTSTPTTTKAPISTAKPTAPQAQPTSAPTSKPGSYVLAGSGKNSCGSHSKISSESACRAAATSLGYGFRSAFDSSTWPAGCFKYSTSSAYWNKHSTGRGNDSANPICEKCENCTSKPTTTAAPTTTSVFVKASKGEATCGDHTVISSESVCKAAAKYFQLGYRSAFASTYYPIGCWQYGSAHVYFNKGSTGRGNSNTTPLCTKSTTTTAAPTASTSRPTASTTDSASSDSDSSDTESTDTDSPTVRTAQPTSPPVVRTGNPTPKPVVNPTPAPVVKPTLTPVVRTGNPTPAPVVQPTSEPVAKPTLAPVVRTGTPTVFPTKKTEVESGETSYVVKEGVNACPNGSTALEHKKSCIAAVESLDGAEFVGGVLMSSYPAGCFMYSKNSKKYVFFNGHNSGTKESSSAVICAEESTTNKQMDDPLLFDEEFLLRRRNEIELLDDRPVMESLHEDLVHERVEELIAQMLISRN